MIHIDQHLHSVYQLISTFLVTEKGFLLLSQTNLLPVLQLLSPDSSGNIPSFLRHFITLVVLWPHFFFLIVANPFVVTHLSFFLAAHICIGVWNPSTFYSNPLFLWCFTSTSPESHTSHSTYCHILC